MRDRSPSREPSDAWRPALYDTKLAFNAHYGRDLVEVLEPRGGERILDLGCGTGHLTRQIAERGATVVGLDRSEAMLDRARAQHPGLAFVLADGQHFAFPAGTFDAVFSNAALHWMPDAAGVARCVWDALKPGGRFVAEFGGKGNIAALVAAARAARAAAGLSVEHFEPWFFPTLGEYATLLERHGFRVVQAAHFDRPTPLDDGAKGLQNWLEGFGARLFGDAPESEHSALAERIEERLRPVLFRDGRWIVDYVRLRIEAVKETP